MNTYSRTSPYTYDVIWIMHRYVRICARTHDTHTHTHTRARARTHTHTHTHTHIYKLIYMLDINIYVFN